MNLGQEILDDTMSLRIRYALIEAIDNYRLEANFAWECVGKNSLATRSHDEESKE